jgi:hypothetical protein
MFLQISEVGSIIWSSPYFSKTVRIFIGNNFENPNLISHDFLLDNEV